jgi:hypothetical protein
MLATNYVNEAKRGVVAGQFESVADARDLLKAEMSISVKPLQRRMTPNLPPVHETMWNAALATPNLRISQSMVTRHGGRAVEARPVARHGRFLTTFIP